jgi:hypothetical protein
MQKRRATISKDIGLDKPILQHLSTPGNKCRQVGAAKVARACHWTYHQTVSVARPDTNLIPLGTQYGAARSNPKKRNRLRNAEFATSCIPLQLLSDHS